MISAMDGSIFCSGSTLRVDIAAHMISPYHRAGHSASGFHAYAQVDYVLSLDEDRRIFSVTSGGRLSGHVLLRTGFRQRVARQHQQGPLVVL